MTTDKTDQVSEATELLEDALDDVQGAGMSLRAGTSLKPVAKDAGAAIQETRFRVNMTDP